MRPDELNVCERVAEKVPPFARELERTNVPISVAPVPESSVAVWKRLVKPVPVDAVPVFEMVEERVRAAPVVAVVGVTEPAIRFETGAEEIVIVCVPNPERRASASSARTPKV